MGKEGYILELGKDRVVQVPARMTVVASQANLDQLKEICPEEAADELVLCPLDPTDEIPEETVANAGVIVVEVDPNSPRSMHRIAQIHAQRPELQQIVALADANLATTRMLLRQGVADVVSLPFDFEELLDAAVNLVEKPRKAARGDVSYAPLVAVVRAEGGGGATTVLTHLAHHLAEIAPKGRGACIIDLDVQFGSVAPLLGLTPRRTLEDLLDAGGRLDGAVLRSVAMERDDGVSVIAAPLEIQPLEQIDTEQLLKVIEIARLEYDYVLIDLPANWTSWNLSTLMDASKILMVVELQIASLRQAKRRLQLFNSVGIGKGRVEIVVNRMERKLFGAIGLDDVADTLKRDVVAGLHDEGTALRTAQDQGLLLPEYQRKSKFDKDVAALADKVANQLSSGDQT